MSRQPGSKVFAHRDVQSSAAFYRGENRRDLRRGLWTSDVHPILSTKSHRSHRVLGQVIAQLQSGIFQKPGEPVPEGERVVVGLGERTPRQCGGTKLRLADVEQWTDHLGTCSQCYRDFTAFRKEPRASDGGTSCIDRCCRSHSCGRRMAAGADELTNSDKRGASPVIT